MAKTGVIGMKVGKMSIVVEHKELIKKLKTIIKEELPLATKLIVEVDPPIRFNQWRPSCDVFLHIIFKITPETKENAQIIIMVGEDPEKVCRGLCAIYNSPTPATGITEYIKRTQEPNIPKVPEYREWRRGVREYD